MLRRMQHVKKREEHVVEGLLVAIEDGEFQEPETTLQDAEETPRLTHPLQPFAPAYVFKGIGVFVWGYDHGPL